MTSYCKPGFMRAVYGVILFYIWIAAVCFVLSISDTIEWMCKGCKTAVGPNDEAMGFVGRTFDPFKFNDHSECSICLCEFEAEELVTVLPCDVRHYFHSECIRDWSKRSTTCPLCK